jgi:hypothetical protein
MSTYRIIPFAAALIAFATAAPAQTSAAKDEPTPGRSQYSPSWINQF